MSLPSVTDFQSLPATRSPAGTVQCPTWTAPTLRSFEVSNIQIRLLIFLPAKLFYRVIHSVHAQGILYTQNTDRNLEISGNLFALRTPYPVWHRSYKFYSWNICQAGCAFCLYTTNGQPPNLIRLDFSDILLATAATVTLTVSVWVQWPCHNRKTLFHPSFPNL